MTRRNRTEPREEGAGWRAFLLGMVGMFAVIALWVALVEPVEPETEAANRPAEVEQAERPALGAAE